MPVVGWHRRGDNDMLQVNAPVAIDDYLHGYGSGGSLGIDAANTIQTAPAGPNLSVTFFKRTSNDGKRVLGIVARNREGSATVIALDRDNVESLKEFLEGE